AVEVSALHGVSSAGCPPTPGGRPTRTRPRQRSSSPYRSSFPNPFAARGGPMSFEDATRLGSSGTLPVPGPPPSLASSPSPGVENVRVDDGTRLGSSDTPPVPGRPPPP